MKNNIEDEAQKAAFREKIYRSYDKKKDSQIIGTLLFIGSVVLPIVITWMVVDMARDGYVPSYWLDQCEKQLDLKKFL